MKKEVKCQMCQAPFMARIYDLNRGYGKYCCSKCSNAAKGKKRQELYPSQGEKNPNWKGGISTNYYHYKKIQKQRYPERVSAREKVRYALKVGNIVKKDCCVCGDSNVFAHHIDYKKPLDVVWLCRKHHREEHGGRH
jgi:hypothetical protein